MKIEMTFNEKIANYILGNFSISQIPEIFVTALNEGIESESLLILTGMTEKDNTFEIEQYFNKALSEIKIVLPSKIESAKIILCYYLNEILLNPEKAFEIMSLIDIKVYDKIDKEKGQKTLGKELGLEHMYTWYRELQDFADNSMLFYYNDLPRNEQKLKFESHLVIESKNLFDKLKEK